MTAEQQAEHDRIVKESQERTAKREQGFFEDVLSPISGAIDPNRRSLYGYYGGVTPPLPISEHPGFAESLEPLKIFDVLGRGIRKLVTGMSETQLAAPGEESRLIASIATDMLTDPLMALGLAKGAVSGLRGIRGMLDDVVSVNLAQQDPGVAQMFSRVRPEQLDQLAQELQQGLLEGGFKRLPPNYQRALTRFYADQRGSLFPGYAGVFPKSDYNMYSQMGRSLEQKLPGRSTPQELRQLVKKFVQKGDYKKAELDWSGLEGWLTQQHLQNPKAKLSKADVLEYVRANELQIEPYTRRGAGASSQYRGYTMGDSRNFENYEETLVRLPTMKGRFEGHFGEYEDVIAHFRTVERMAPDEAGKPQKTLFVEEIQSDWHQKGRTEGYAGVGETEDFREAKVTFEAAEENYDVLQQDYGMDADDAEYQLRDTRSDIETAETDLVEAQDQLEFSQNELDDEIERLTELEEGQQSLPGIDVAPERPPHLVDEVEKWQSEVDAAEEEVRTLTDRADDLESSYETLYEAEQDLDYARTEWRTARDELSERPPEAPFGKTWPELAFKRIIQKAIDEGYDQVAWTPGYAQADRYNMAKQVEDIKWVKPQEGYASVGPDQILLRYRLKTEVEAGLEANWKDQLVPAKDISDWVGKDLGKKITEGADIGRLENAELWMGGEPLKFFYDNELRRTANKLVKRFGSKVEQASMGPTYQITPAPADAAKFWGWVDTEINRLEANAAQLKRQIDLSQHAPGGPLTGQVESAGGYTRQMVAVRENLRSAQDTARRQATSLRTARSGETLEGVEPIIFRRFEGANPNAEVKYVVTDPGPGASRPATYETLEEATKAAAPTAWTIKITPKMREAVRERGFPLFDILLGTTGAAAGGTAAAAEAMSAHKEGQ